MHMPAQEVQEVSLAIKCFLHIAISIKSCVVSTVCFLMYIVTSILYKKALTVLLVLAHVAFSYMLLFALSWFHCIYWINQLLSVAVVHH